METLSELPSDQSVNDRHMFVFSKGSSRVRWLLVSLLFVISAVAYLDRVNISIAGQAIAREFHLSNIQLGWMFSAFVLGYALFQAPAGRIADRFGARLVLGVGVVWWAIFTCLITFISPSLIAVVSLLISVRFLLGVGEAVMYPASNCIISTWIPTAERGMANGLIFAGVGFGAGIAPPLITYSLPNYAWRASFWLSAGLGLLAGGAWFVIARDRPEQHMWVSSEELEHIQAGLPLRRVASNGSGPSWMEIIGLRDVQALTFSYFTYGYAVYIFFSWFFIYLNTVRGLNLKQSSYYSMLPFMAMAIASPLGGWLSDRLTRSLGKRAGRCYLALVSMTLCSFFLMVGTHVRNVPFAVVVLAGGAGALYLAQSSFWSVSADLGGNAAGSFSGVMNMGCQLGGALSSSATAVIATHFGWTASFVVASVLTLAGAIAWLYVAPEDGSTALRQNDDNLVRTHSEHRAEPE
jgi:ACS family glucarate transporter-like MFS transporter